MNKTKNCNVRIPADLHRLAKLKAYEKGITLQQYIHDLILKELGNDKKNEV